MMAAKGPQGDEYLAKMLNSYFEQLVKVISSQGGDVFKFAGDALVVLWPPSSSSKLASSADTPDTPRFVRSPSVDRAKLEDLRAFL